MNLKNKIIDTAISKLIQLAPNNKLFAEYHNRTQRRRLGYNKQAVNMQAKTLSDWKFALMTATDPNNPMRGDLMRFYLNNLMLDDHLGSVIETRSLAVQQASFIVVDQNNKENDKLKELLQREWMLDLIDRHVFATFQGTTLLELYDTHKLTGELTTLNEIPQSNFIAPKGLFLKYEYDRDGYDYKSPLYTPYYAQIGGDWDIGMLGVLAPIILAKKLGLGSWLSYIDKFGVPPIFAITDRLDTARRDELFDMMTDFRQNQFAILQGNETIQIPSNYNVDAYATFEALHKLGDRNISKRVLGQTGTTDEKSFVGSAKVHEKVAKSRHEADKLRFTYYFNNEIRWRLVKLSAVYADFATHTLKFDNAESLDTNDYIDGVTKMSPYYSFDVQEIAQKTGLPITGAKEFGFTQMQEPEKQTQQATASYQVKLDNSKPQPKITAHTLDIETDLELTAIDLSGWEPIMEKIYKDIYEGKIKPTEISTDYVKKAYTTFNDALGKGLQKNTNILNYEEKDFKTITALQQNLFKFSCAKNFQMQQQINALLLDENGKRRTLGDFERQVQKLGVAYNKNWLKTEWRMTTAVAQNVKNWEQYKSTAGVYPNLKVMPTSAKEPRENHKVLEGMILPIDHAWWKQNGLPPWDWNCMHRVEPVKDEVHAEAPEVVINPIFAHNPAESGEVFTGKHPYFSMNTRLLNDFKQGTELQKEYAPYNKLHQGAKGKVMGSIWADKKDLKLNLETAKIITENIKETIHIRPHININGVKNPEYLIRGEFADRKGIKSIDSGVAKAISAARKQVCTRVVIDFNEHNVAMNVDILARRLKGSMASGINKIVEEVYLVKDNVTIKLSRADIQSEQLTKLLEKLKGA